MKTTKDTKPEYAVDTSNRATESLASTSFIGDGTSKLFSNSLQVIQRGINRALEENGDSPTDYQLHVFEYPLQAPTKSLPYEHNKVSVYALRRN